MTWKNKLACSRPKGQFEGAAYKLTSLILFLTLHQSCKYLRHWNKDKFEQATVKAIALQFRSNRRLGAQFKMKQEGKKRLRTIIFAPRRFRQSEKFLPAIKSNASCRVEVGHGGKHSLQSKHTSEAIPGMKLIARVGPRSTKPTAFFYLIEAE
jgi:hypothetical protein